MCTLGVPVLTQQYSHCLQNSFSPLWKEEYGGSEEMLLVSRITCVCIISVYLRQCNTIHTDCNVEKLPEEDTAAAGQGTVSVQHYSH